MLKRWAGSLVTTAVLGGVVLILLLNVDLGGKTKTPNVPTPPTTGADAPPRPAIEHPIGDTVVKNQIKVDAVWLPAVAMDDSAAGGSDLIHIEADVKATEGNPNGFAFGEFVPYLKITYSIVTDGGAKVDQGELRPMVASDGLHYGANVAMPKAGKFRLTYAIEPPSVGGLGRHSDRATGVAPWWPPFEAAFDWDYPGPTPGP